MYFFDYSGSSVKIFIFIKKSKILVKVFLAKSKIHKTTQNQKQPDLLKYPNPQNF